MLLVLGFNLITRDIERNRSLGLATTRPELVQAALRLFEADSRLQPYTATEHRLLVSPVNSRGTLLAMIEGASRRLWIYDMRITDELMLEALERRAEAGVEVRVIGAVRTPIGAVQVRHPARNRLHLRAILADSSKVFVGSQSLRRVELEQRREIGLLLEAPHLAERVAAIFRRDWKRAGAAYWD
jgi:cardiolipin synthase